MLFIPKEVSGCAEKVMLFPSGSLCLVKRMSHPKKLLSELLCIKFTLPLITFAGVYNIQICNG